MENKKNTKINKDNVYTKLNKLQNYTAKKHISKAAKGMYGSFYSIDKLRAIWTKANTKLFGEGNGLFFSYSLIDYKILKEIKNVKTDATKFAPAREEIKILYGIQGSIRFTIVNSTNIIDGKPEEYTFDRPFGGMNKGGSLSFSIGGAETYAARYALQTLLWAGEVASLDPEQTKEEEVVVEVKKEVVQPKIVQPKVVQPIIKTPPTITPKKEEVIEQIKFVAPIKEVVPIVATAPPIFTGDNHEVEFAEWRKNKIKDVNNLTFTERTAEDPPFKEYLKNECVKMGNFNLESLPSEVKLNIVKAWKTKKI